MRTMSDNRDHVVPHPARGTTSPTFDDALKVHRLHINGWYQHEIAAKLGFNQGRISEVMTGKRHPLARIAVEQEVNYGKI
jgi:hypothetical protein